MTPCELLPGPEALVDSRHPLRAFVHVGIALALLAAPGAAQV